MIKQIDRSIGDDDDDIDLDGANRNVMMIKTCVESMVMLIIYDTKLYGANSVADKNYRDQSMMMMM